MKDTLVVSHERSGTHLTINTIGLNIKNVPIPGFGYVSGMNITQYMMDNKFGGIWKSHHHSTYFDIEKLIDNFNVIYVKREIKDTLNSCWFYYRKNQVFKCNTNINEWVFESPKFKNGVDPYNPIFENFVIRWIEHVNSWLKYKNSILIINYENIIDDFNSVREELSKYLGINIREDIPSLKESSVYPRKGIIGDYKNNMNKITIDKINNIYKNKINI